MKKDKLTNLADAPIGLYLWLANDDYDYSKDPMNISVTTLLRSPRYIIAEKRKYFPELFNPKLIEEDKKFIKENNSDSLEDVQTKVASSIGTAIHNGIENVWKNPNRELLKDFGLSDAVIDKIRVNPNVNKYDPNFIDVFLEQRINKTFEVYDQTYKKFTFTVGGKYDFIIDGELNDFKSTTAYSYYSGAKDLDYIKQGSYYRVLNPDIITKDNININFIFTDFKEFEVNKINGYPLAKAIAKKYPLMPLDEAENSIKDVLKTVALYWDIPLKDIPCCDEEKMYGNKKSVFKYYKVPGSSRSTKNCDTLQEALNVMNSPKYNGKGEIVEVKPTAFKCKYCDKEAPSIFYSVGQGEDLWQ